MEKQNIIIVNSGFRYVCYIVFKRIIDILGGLLGSVLALPVLFCVKIAYLISGDTGKLIFTQERIGMHGKTVKIYKIRSMIVNAEEALNNLLERDAEAAAEYEKYKKLKNDPRITKAGKIVRRYSIDEVPQFFNVLIGNLSLVGPRPYLWREKEAMEDAYDIIITAKPGVSGYWQVNGRSNTDFKKRLRMDKFYCTHKNTGLDLKIIFLTFYKVLKREGAE